MNEDPEVTQILLTYAERRLEALHAHPDPVTYDEAVGVYLRAREAHKLTQLQASEANA